MDTVVLLRQGQKAGNRQCERWRGVGREATCGAGGEMRCWCPLWAGTGDTWIRKCLQTHRRAREELLWVLSPLLRMCASSCPGFWPQAVPLAAAAAILSWTAAPPQPPLQTSLHDPRGATELSVSLWILNLPVLDYGDVWKEMNTG